MPWRTRCLNAASSVRKSGTWIVRRMVVGSRPMSWQCWPRTLNLLRDLFGGALDVRGVGVLGDGKQRALFAAAADEDRRVGLLDVRRVVRRLVELVVAALEHRLRLRPELLDHLDGFVEAAEALASGVEGDGEGVVLVGVPGGAEAELEAAVGDVVDGRGLLGEDGGMAVGVAGDEDAEADARGGLGEGGEGGPALHAGALGAEGGAEAGDEVVHQPEAVEVGVLVEVLPGVEEVGPADAGLGGDGVEFDCGHGISGLSGERRWSGRVSNPPLRGHCRFPAAV